MSRRAKSATNLPQGPLKEIEEHVEGFRQVREAHRRELIDDYVELISDLIREFGEARQVDMAARLGVSQPTVAKMLKRLSTTGLVEQVPYRGVFLTAEGEKLAEASRVRHHIVETFLLIPKGWSITSVMKPSPSSRNFTRIANLQGLLPSCPSCFVP